MKVQVENLEKNMAKLTIEVEADRFEQAVNAAYNKQKNSISIPGFRKGKVPRAMVEKMYGAEIFFEDAANILIQETYPEAYDQSGVDIVSQPTIDVVQIEKGKDFIYTAEVALKPEVTLGKYKGVQVTKVSTNVTATELKEAVNKELEKSARTVSKKTKIVDGDTAVIDFEGFMDGVAFEGGKGENYDLVIGSHSFIDGFEDQLIGHKAGEEVEVNVTFPENYQADELAGKPAVFKCKINEVKGKDIPKLDDEFVADTTEFSTVDEYKESIKAKLVASKEADAKRAKEDEAIDKIIEDSKMDIPEAMIDNQVQSMINEFANSMAQQGLGLEQYMQFTGMTMDGFKEQVRPEALHRIQSTLVLEAVANAEKIEATDADVDAKIQEMADMYGMEVDKIKEFVKDAEKESMKADIRIEKAVEFIVENCKEKAKSTKKAADEAEAEAPAEEKPAKKTTAKKTTKKTEE